MCRWFYSPWWRNQPSAGVFVPHVQWLFCWKLWLLGGLCSGFLCSCTQHGWGGWKELSWEPLAPPKASASGWVSSLNHLCVLNFYLENDWLGSCLWRMQTSAPILGGGGEYWIPINLWPSIWFPAGWLLFAETVPFLKKKTKNKSHLCSVDPAGYNKRQQARRLTNL